MNLKAEFKYRDVATQYRAGWRCVKLGNLIEEYQTGFACGQRDPKGVVQLRMNNVDTRGNFIWDDVLRVPVDEETVGQYMLQPGDVVFNNTNSTELVGKSAVFEAYREPVVYSNHFTRLRTKRDALVPDFLGFWLNHQWLVGSFARICNRWIGQSAVKSDKLLALEIPLPPFVEQQRIAALLREQMETVEKARKSAEERRQASRGLAAAFLRDSFREVEFRNYPMCKLGDVAELLPSKSISRNGDLTVPVITTACLSEFGFEQAGIKEARMCAGDAAKSKVTKGEVLIARSNTSDLVGRVSMFPGAEHDIYASDLTIRILPTDALHSGYLTYFLKVLYLSGYWKERAGGASGSMKKITRTHILNLDVPIPPTVEQERLSAHLDGSIAKARLLRSMTEIQFDSINQLPGALLRNTFETIL